MKELGFNVVIEEGATGQFEIFTLHSDEWASFIKEGHGKFFTLRDVEKRLSRIS
jgi:hypothetical protein|tara:strand:- start:1968 stop:2129 length:162 start_codon:yes stop_codon:yes gene_type:complete